MIDKEYANVLMPHIDKDISYYEEKYPKRNLSDSAIVTRFAPSPTGFVHIGGLLATFVASKFAKQTNGVVFLRIEDTDQKREVENGLQGIIDDMNNLDCYFDEGPISATEERGDYGPYIQSKRGDIYQTFAKHLIEKGLAYPCFCSEVELDEIRVKQERVKDRIGYWGPYAKCRNLSREEVTTKVKNGEKFILRLKSPGNFDNKKIFIDLIKGNVEMPENDIDIVIIKSDGLPTYHFAHLTDDYLMQTTHIIRGDEWFPSLPIHVQLFETFGFKMPNYAHISPLLKNDEGSLRKLSKRKDPESKVSFYHETGIPNEAIKLYLATIANSNFEEWYDKNSYKIVDDFELRFNKISSSGSIFDLDKLLNISKNFISRLTAEEIYNRVLKYSNEYDKEFYKLLKKYKDYSIGIYNIERNPEKPRKDYVYFSDIKNQTWYMYDELFEQKEVVYEYQNITDKNEIKNILNIYISKYYDDLDDKETWFNKIKELANELGYAKEMKEYKANPNAFKGNVADISTVLRVSLTTQSKTPDLYEIMKLLGHDRIEKRFNDIIKKLLF